MTRHTHTHTHIHTPMPTLDLMCTQTHSHISGCFFCSTSRSASFHTHTHTSSCVLEICLMMTYTHPYPRLIALHNTYFSFTFTGAIPLHACGVARNWHTYFISVWQFFLVETVVLRTVLWDIRAWSAHFLIDESKSAEICRHVAYHW